MESTTATTMNSEGRVQFDSIPNDLFRYSLQSDKVETIVTLESKQSKQKWQVRADDAQFKSFGPKDTEIPRSIVVQCLLETLQANGSPSHSLALVSCKDHAISLELTLSFESFFTPVFVIPLLPLAMAKEEILEAHVRDLQEELDALKLQQKTLQDDLDAHKKKAGDEISELHSEVENVQEALHQEIATTAKRFEASAKPLVSLPSLASLGFSVGTYCMMAYTVYWFM